mgnify:CR=1 FL=1
MRYLIKFSYDGTKFHGFQRQNDVKNVQGTLEKVLSDVFESDIVIKGSGRTDASVHAEAQCAHFDVDKKITKEDINIINRILNEDIVIKNYKLVKNDFHARHDVKYKKYVYKLNIGDFDKLKEGYYYQRKFKLDFSLMKRAMKLFVGTHDFRNFVSGPRIDYTTTIYKAKLKKKGSIILFEFVGIGFYRYMVRHLVGALVDVGRGKAKVSDVERMLDNPLVEKNLSVVPADGLYLVDVKY